MWATDLYVHSFFSDKATLRVSNKVSEHSQVLRDTNNPYAICDYDSPKMIIWYGVSQFVITGCTFLKMGELMVQLTWKYGMDSVTAACCWVFMLSARWSTSYFSLLSQNYLDVTFTCWSVKLPDLKPCDFGYGGW